MRTKRSLKDAAPTPRSSAFAGLDEHQHIARMHQLAVFGLEAHDAPGAICRYFVEDLHGLHYPITASASTQSPSLTYAAPKVSASGIEHPRERRGNGMQM